MAPQPKRNGIFSRNVMLKIEQIVNFSTENLRGVQERSLLEICELLQGIMYFYDTNSSKKGGIYEKEGEECPSGKIKVNQIRIDLSALDAKL